MVLDLISGGWAAWMAGAKREESADPQPSGVSTGVIRTGKSYS